MEHQAPVVVTGGTGTLGRPVVARLRAAGHAVRVLSRHPGPAADGVEQVACDLQTGSGLEPALAGTEVVLHLAGGPRGDDVIADRLARAAAEAGVRHLVLVSIIGVDRLPIGFYRTKVAAERAVVESGVPFTILRAAQFHDFVLGLVERAAASPVLPAPRGMRFQPVDTRDVAARLVELAEGPPAGMVPDLPGPEVLALGDLVRSYLAASGKRRLVVPLPLPGAVGRAYREGLNLSTDSPTGRRTWAEFLEERVAR